MLADGALEKYRPLMQALADAAHAAAAEIAPPSRLRCSVALRGSTVASKLLCPVIDFDVLLHLLVWPPPARPQESWLQAARIIASFPFAGPHVRSENTLERSNI